MFNNFQSFFTFLHFFVSQNSENCPPFRNNSYNFSASFRYRRTFHRFYPFKYSSFPLTSSRGFNLFLEFLQTVLKYFSDSDALPGRRGRSKADPTRGEEGETRAQREFFKREARTALTRDTSAAPSVNRRAITTRESPLVKTLLEPPTFVRINKETRNRSEEYLFFSLFISNFSFFSRKGSRRYDCWNDDCSVRMQPESFDRDDGNPFKRVRYCMPARDIYAYER